MTLQKRMLTCAESSPVFCRVVMEGFMDVIMAVIVICSNIPVSVHMMQHHPACTFATLFSNKCADAQNIIPSHHNICNARSVSKFRTLHANIAHIALHTLAERLTRQAHLEVQVFEGLNSQWSPTEGKLLC